MKPKITVIKAPRPEQRRRPLRPQGRQHRRQGLGRPTAAPAACSSSPATTRSPRSPPSRHRPRRLRGHDHLRRRRRAPLRPSTAPAGSTSAPARRSSARSATPASAPSRSRSRPTPTRRAARASASAGFAGSLQPRRRRRQDDRARRPARRRLRVTARTKAIGLPPVGRSAATTATARRPSPPAPRASSVGAGEKVRCTFVNTKLVPGLHVVKDGPARRAPRRLDDLHVRGRRTAATRRCTNVHVTDDRCADVSAEPVERRDRRRRRRCSRPDEVWVFELHDAGRPRIRRPSRTRSTTSPRRPARTRRARTSSATDDH